MNSPATLKAWLDQVGLSRLEQTFLNNGIDLDVVRSLTDGDLRELGFTLGDRKRVLGAISTLAGSVAQSGPLPPEPTLPNRSEAERRQLTVMFCDLVGSTALSGRMDPEDLREVISTYQKCVADTVRRFDGFLAKYMGDGVLVYFGYPRAHEDDAERAVRAGLSLVQVVGQLQAAEPLRVRIGIATGLVIVGDLVGAGEAQERGIVGETPNLAARLLDLAEPGTIVVAASTRRLLGSRFGLCDLGRHELKGFAEPVECWAVEGISVAESRFESVHSGRLTGFVGREQELGLLMGCWKLAQDGEGQVVLLSGEPGIGKSRILSELRTRLETYRAISLRFHCSPYYVNSAFYPIIDNFERTLQLAHDETADQKFEKLEALIVGQYGHSRDDARLIAAMLSIPYEARYGTVAMTPQKFKDETLRALIDIVEAAARQQPTVMLFEDAQWADPTTLEAMDLLVHRLRDIPLLVVVTHRPDFVNRWSRHDHVTSLTLMKLTRPQSSAMVAKLTGDKALPADLLEQIIAKADGVPLFLEELIKSLLESADLKNAGDRWEYVGDADHLAIPLTLRDLLLARLDRFTPVKEIAQIGAAIGREFGYELIAAVAPHAKAELDEALAQLTASGLAFQQGTPPAAVYTFKHALVQDAAYDSMLRRRRQELHDKIARVIEEQSPNVEETEPELLAHHYTEAKQPLALHLWQQAGSLALRRMALTEAIAHLNKGLGLVAALPRSADRDGKELSLRTLLGTAWIGLRGWASHEVWDALYPALGLANSLRRNDALVPTLFGLWANTFTTGRVAESLRWFTQTLGAAEAYGDPALQILGHYTGVVSYFYLGDLVSARQHADRLLTLYAEERHGHLMSVIHQDPKTVGLAYASLLTWLFGCPAQAIQIREAKEAHARGLGHPFDLGWALTMGATVLDPVGRPDELLKRVEEAERLGREHRLPVLTAFLGPCHSGIALIHKGQFAEGVASLKAGLAVWEASGGRTGVHFKLVLAEGIAQLGDLDGALDLMDEITVQIERPGWGERWCFAEILRIKGWLLSLKGDLPSAEREYVASLNCARRQQAKSWELRTSTSYARLMRNQGRLSEAQDLLAPVYGWFTEGFDTPDLREAKALLIELHN